MDLVSQQPLVLLAEADALVSMDVGDALEQGGYRVLGPFARGAEALSLIQHVTPALAIIDVMLKDGPCPELARVLHRRGIPFVVHSSCRQDEPLAAEFQGVPWVTKPALPSDVVTLCEVLSRPSSAPTLGTTSPEPTGTEGSALSRDDDVNPFVRKLDSLVALTAADCKVLEQITAETHLVPAGTDLVREGDRPDGVYLVMDGLVCRHKFHAGRKRQIMAYLLPGDLGDIDVMLLEAMDHTLTALIDTRLIHLTAETVADLIGQHPRIARALRMTTLVDQATLREWLVNVGCRSAIGRVAHLLCELHLRFRAIGMSAEDSFVLPLTEVELADTTGLKQVEVACAMQTMQQQGLLERQGGRLMILSPSRLKAAATFNPNYLHLRDRLAA